METAGTALPPAKEKRIHYWLRVLRPLSWWVLMVILMFTYRTHQRLAEQTHLNFTVSLDGQPLQFDASITLDGQPVASGEWVPLGRHRFAVSHPKGDSYSTNLFIWYGEHNLGRINLKRSRGTLMVTANPAAGLITIQGPEFSLRLTNSAGLTTNIPTDRYVVEVYYAHWQQIQEATVNSMVPWTCPFAPRLGSVQLTCNQSGASFQVVNGSGQLLEAGDLPAAIPEVPEGSYKLVAWHRKNKNEQTLVVKGGATNNTEVRFLYGAARLESDPPGATVATADGQEWGVTPLLFPELTVGRWQFHLRLAGYSSVTAQLDIATLQTNTFRTNLVSLNYSRAVSAARQYLATADYDRALSAATEALQARANDADAIAIQKEALGKRHLRQAESLGKKADYIAADKELEAALQSLPDNEEAKQLLADFKPKESEQREQLRQDRLAYPKSLMDLYLAHTADAQLFELHELKTTKPVQEVQSAVVRQLQTGQPKFEILMSSPVGPESFKIQAKQDVSGGQRQCFIVCGQTRDNEVQILYIVLEFKTHHKVSMQGLLNFRDDIDYIPVHPSKITDFTDKLKAQVEDGQKIVAERIQKAIE